MAFGSISYAVEGAEPQVLELQPGVTTIGSADDNDVVLNGIGLYHLRLVCTPTECWVMNLETENPAFLNYVRMQANMRYPLRDADIVRIGPFFLRYTRPEPTEASLPLQRRRPAMLPPEIAGRLSDAESAERRRRLPARRLPGNVAAPPPSTYLGTRKQSNYLQYLPAIYQNQEFIGRMLLIFENMLEPLDHMVGDLPFYFDPRTAPKALLPWLASWLDLVLNENWPLERRRALILAAAELYRWRGTKRGLINYLRIYTGVTPTIIEPHESSELAEYTFKVRLALPKGASIDERLVSMIIDAEKPAHTTYSLEIQEES